MTEIERKALLARLLDFDDNWHEASCKEAADTLEAQAAEIEKLREVVVNYVDPFDVTPEDEAFVEAVQRAALEAKP